MDFKGDIEDRLVKFMKKKRNEAIEEMVAEEELIYGKVNEIVEKCEFTEKKPDFNEIKESFSGKVSVLKLNKKIQSIQERIEKILDRFNFFNMN